ncbi:HAMP domain-containing histidine kinase [Clostridium senegalense]|uniref:sensor histidine kinase n=1 Tax=Clostridium senegalense TaxID=1465809 RepID=UPI001C0FA13A|nr:HAMP domain-containing sensor histidine kinase [Clostridium senegalense]MBU5226823.1 HAMP domain-containing histidine kinase [Clostridium senegalense]
MFKNLKLKKLLSRMVIYIIFFTVITTIIVEGILFILLNNSFAKKTSYYSNLLPQVEQYIQDKKVDILDEKEINFKEIDSNFKGEYVGLNGKHISGEYLLDEDKRKNIINNLNRNICDHSDGYKFIGIIDSNLNLKGAYVIKYPFNIFKNNSDNKLFLPLNIAILISPFCILIFYLIVFTRLAYISINSDIKNLKIAIKRIEDKDLEFEIINNHDTEMGMLMRSVNNMKNTLREYIEKNIEVEEEKRFIIRTITHDIKTPLTIILGQTDMIKEVSNEYQNIEKYINSILRNCNRIYILIKELSVIYSMQNNNINVNLSEENLIKYIDDKVEEFESIAKLNNINIKKEYHLSKDTYSFDKLLLNHILDNLFSNSLKFVKSEGRIGIKIEEKEKKLYFTCYDTGPGFKNVNINKVFEMFYMGCHEKNSENFGLGLYICKKIVIKLGGGIKAYNNELNGATIKFYIPIC